MIKSMLSTCLSNPRHFPRGYFLAATGSVKSFAASFLYNSVFYDLNKCLSRVNVVSSVIHHPWLWLISLRFIYGSKVPFCWFPGSRWQKKLEWLRLVSSDHDGERRERENHCGGVRAVSQNRKHANIHGPWVSREIFDEKNIRRKYWQREWCPHPCHNADNGNTQRWPETRGLCLGSCAIMSQAPELASHWSGSREIRPLIGQWGPSVEA